MFPPNPPLSGPASTTMPTPRPPTLQNPSHPPSGPQPIFGSAVTETLLRLSAHMYLPTISLTLTHKPQNSDYTLLLTGLSCLQVPITDPRLPQRISQTLAQNCQPSFRTFWPPFLAQQISHLANIQNTDSIMHTVYGSRMFQGVLSSLVLDEKIIGGIMAINAATGELEISLVDVQLKCVRMEDREGERKGAFEPVLRKNVEKMFEGRDQFGFLELMPLEVSFLRRMGCGEDREVMGQRQQQQRQQQVSFLRRMGCGEDREVMGQRQPLGQQHYQHHQQQQHHQHHQHHQQQHHQYHHQQYHHQHQQQQQQSAFVPALPLSQVPQPTMPSQQQQQQRQQQQQQQQQQSAFAQWQRQQRQRQRQKRQRQQRQQSAFAPALPLPQVPQPTMPSQSMLGEQQHVAPPEDEGRKEFYASGGLLNFADPMDHDSEQQQQQQLESPFRRAPSSTPPPEGALENERSGGVVLLERGGGGEGGNQASSVEEQTTVLSFSRVPSAENESGEEELLGDDDDLFGEDKPVPPSWTSRLALPPLPRRRTPPPPPPTA